MSRASHLKLVAVLGLVVLLGSVSRAAEKIRVYHFGEDDPGATLGADILETQDSQLPPVLGSDTSGGADLVPLIAEFAGDEPTYVEGRGGAGTLAADFDGLFDRLIGPPFDPRNFNGSFNALSQAWLRPDSAKQGQEQFVWSLGTDNGGVGITEDGFWQIIASNVVPDTASSVPVAFDEWTHVALHRTGNNAFLYVDGQLVTSGAGFWNGPGEVTVGNRTSEDPFLSIAHYDGAIDDLALSGFGFDGDFALSPAEDLDFFADLVLSGTPGDVDQDGDADVDDYDIWSQNVGFDNGLGNGDPSTLLMGDLDQNGRINFFDFHAIRQAAEAQGNSMAAAVPEPSSLALAACGLVLIAVWRSRRSGLRRCLWSIACGLLLVAGSAASSVAEVIVAEDFFYVQPTKELGPGGGFQLQDYGGGQNGLGQWTGRWASVGNGIITSTDHTPEEEQFQALVTTGLSLAELNRDYTLGGIADDQELYFGIRMRSGAADETSDARFNINPTESGAEIGLGFIDGFYAARLGDQTGLGLGIPNDGEFHTLIGKLELNAAGSNERLSVWLDPTGPEMGPDSAVVENDVVTGFGDFAGNLELFLDVASGGSVWWDDIALGTTWEDAATVNVPHLLLQVDPDTGRGRLTNSTGSDFTFNYLEIASPTGSLDPENWSSLDDQNFGDGGWQENNPTTRLLTESNFSGSATLADGQSISLGQIRRIRPDLIARVGDATGLLNQVPVEYVALAVEGDYNDNGRVEQADLDLVLLNWNESVDNLPDTWVNQRPTSGIIDQAELDGVLLNWNRTSALGTAAAVPEPANWLLAVLVFALGAAAGRSPR